MKFLIITDDAGNITERAFVDLEANQHWLEQGQKTGEIEAIYSLAGGHGVVMLIDVPSPEALDELMVHRPCNEKSLQVHVLADYKAAAESLRGTYKKYLAELKK